MAVLVHASPPAGIDFCLDLHQPRVKQEIAKRNTEAELLWRQQLKTTTVVVRSVARSYSQIGSHFSLIAVVADGLFAVQLALTGKQYEDCLVAGLKRRLQ